MRNAFKDSTHYYLVFEYVSGGELFDEIVARTFYSERVRWVLWWCCADQPFRKALPPSSTSRCVPPQDASECLLQVLSGIKHCHEINIIHRDLKVGVAFTKE